MLPYLRANWYTRNNRARPESIQFTLSKFHWIWIVDCSSLEGFFRKLKSLEHLPKGQLARKMRAVIDLMTRFPIEIWLNENIRASAIKFELYILNLVTAKTLLLLDRGFYHFTFWLQLV
ncbi:Transposase, IS4 [Richelia intracellularis]|nr:Transposase, IS4 [Richelia intracellularis]